MLTNQISISSPEFWLQLWALTVDLDLLSFPFLHLQLELYQTPFHIYSFRGLPDPFASTSGIGIEQLKMKHSFFASLFHLTNLQYVMKSS